MIVTLCNGQNPPEPGRTRPNPAEPGRHVLFAYLKENNGDAVADRLEGFVGMLISDASSVSHETYLREPGVIEVHARRAVFKALASSPALALTGIGFIGQLYDAHDAAVDPVTKFLDADKRKALAQPVLKDFLAWIRQHRPRLVPHSPIEVAMGYIERQWVAFRGPRKARLKKSGLIERRLLSR